MIVSLLRTDTKNILRDPAYVSILGAPLLIALLLRYGLPLFLDFLFTSVGVNVFPYLPLIHAFMAQLPAYLVGLLLGMIFLEERDEGVLLMWAVTPMGRSGYYLYRLAAAFLLGLIAQLVLFMLLPLSGPESSGEALLFLPVAIAFAGAAPLMMLVLILFAKDKVSGLALGKISGIILGVPALLLLPESHPARWAGHLFYPLWSVKAFLSLVGSSAAGVLLHAFVSLVLVTFLAGGGFLLLQGATELPLRRRKNITTA